MKSVFVDTSAFVALAVKGDRNHVAATRHLRDLGKHRRQLVTSTYIFDETVTLMRMRLSHQAAVAVGEGLMTTHWCRVLDVTDETRTQAWHWFKRYDDQLFSFTDCTSFALMHALGLTEAFTFDLNDFAAAGFVPLPGATRTTKSKSR